MSLEIKKSTKILTFKRLEDIETEKLREDIIEMQFGANLRQMGISIINSSKIMNKRIEILYINF